MNETSKGRRVTGKLAILAAAAIALPLTATIVPVYAEDEAKSPEENAEKQVKVHKHKVVIVKSEDGKPVKIDVSGDEDTPFVKTIEKDGKTIVLRSNKELSEEQVAKMVADAEKSRAEAEAMSSADRDGRKHTRVIVKTDVDGASSHSFSWSADKEAMAKAWAADKEAMAKAMNIAAHIPKIDIKELRGKCKDGQPASTSFEGPDGEKQSRILIMMCGKEQAAHARRGAILGLKQARDEIGNDGDIPESVRKDVMKNLEEQIEKLEKQLKTDGGSADDV